jgi:two-component system nitrogen regulation response regulator GlnG
MAFNGEMALDMFRTENPDLVLLDILMPGMDGKEVMLRIREFDQDVPIILMTALAGVPGAVEAMKAGAFDYIAKPFENDEIISIAYRALDERLAKSRYKDMEVEHRSQQDLILKEMGTSDVIVELSGTVKRIATTEFDILITGEHGSGKALVARAIHEASGRGGHPFITLDCSAIPTANLERELFGFADGVFEDREKGESGAFEESEGGTLYLKEVGNLPMKAQARLLRALQEKRVIPLGETEGKSVNVRLVASTTRDLHAMIEERQFRPDLYYRLNEFSIHVPSLRERKTDIPFLASRFIQQANEELDKHVTGFTPKALDALISFKWPGNVSQLRSVVRRAVLFAEDFVSTEQLDLEMAEERRSTPAVEAEGEDANLQDGMPLREHVKRHTAQIERQILLETLKRTGWNKAKAARILKIDYKTMQTKVKEYRLQEPEV